MNEYPPNVDELDESFEDPYDYDDSMDGDWESAMTSAGWGEDESYNHWAEDF